MSINFIILILDIKLEIANPRSFCGCDTDYCPWKKCMCCEGPTFNGGKPLNRNGFCEHFCFTDQSGFSSCGDGPRYDKGQDCRNCTLIDDVLGN